MDAAILVKSLNPPALYFITNLEDLKKAIESEDGKKLEEIFTKTKKIRKEIVKAGQDVGKPDFGRK